MVAHFDRVGYDTSIIVSKWFMTLFAYVTPGTSPLQTLPLTLLYRLWGTILCDVGLLPLPHLGLGRRAAHRPGAAALLRAHAAASGPRGPLALHEGPARPPAPNPGPARAAAFLHPGRFIGHGVQLPRAGRGVRAGGDATGDARLHAARVATEPPSHPEIARSCCGDSRRRGGTWGRSAGSWSG